MNQEHEKYKASIDLPYPPVQPQTQEKEYACAMLSNIGSGNSEMNAVSLYFYNSVILNPEHADFAKCFHDISIIEMHHLHIFASLAFQMGADPRLWSIQRQRKWYWSPSFNRYPRKIKDVLKNSITGEMETIRQYSKQAENIQDENIVENLNRIILDEEHHIDLFHKMLEDI